MFFILLIYAEKLRELAWSGVPPYLRPTVWRLLLVWAYISFFKLILYPTMMTDPGF